jgi:acetoin:2,6-dichlorophenolindophenol oxidoreductase subunit alpha
MKLDHSDLINMYKLMVQTRLFEEKAAKWYEQSLIKEAPHQCIGQEAIGVGTCYGLKNDDQIVPSLRSRASFFTKGVDVETTLRAMAGKKTSPSKGHETSHHAAYPELGVFFGTGMVGSSISLGVGAALAIQLQGKSNVVLIFFGDGASNRGDFHEAMNLAAVWNLPAVFICENNGIALSTRIEAGMRIKNIADRASGYGIPGVTVDGSDLLAVHEAATKAIERARAGEGPTLLECQVARLCPHVSFIADNRTPQELAELKNTRDPIVNFELYLAANNINVDDLKEIKENIGNELDRSLEKITKEPMPDAADILANVYASEVS